MTATSLGKFTLSAAATASLALGGVAALNPSVAMAATESTGTGAGRPAAVTPEKRVETKKETASDAQAIKTDKLPGAKTTPRNDRAQGPVTKPGDKNEDDTSRPGNAIDKPVGDKGRDTKPKAGDHPGDKDDHADEKGDRGDRDKDKRDKDKDKRDKDKDKGRPGKDGDKDKDKGGRDKDKGRPGKDGDDCDEDTETPKPTKPVTPKPEPTKPVTPKPEPQKPVVTPKPAAPKAETPKAEAPKLSAPKTKDAPKLAAPKADASDLVVRTPNTSSMPKQDVVAAVVTDDRGSTVQVVGERGVAAETGAEEGVSMNAILGMVGLLSAAGVLTLGRRRK